jgi:hypothetical protein
LHVWRYLPFTINVLIDVANLLVISVKRPGVEVELIHLWMDIGRTGQNYTPQISDMLALARLIIQNKIPVRFLSLSASTHRSKDMSVECYLTSLLLPGKRFQIAHALFLILTRHANRRLK